VRRRATVLGIATTTFVLVLVSAVLIVLLGTTQAPNVYGLRGSPAVFALVLTLVGAAIALRQPRNSVGWIFLVSGMFAGLLEAANDYASYALAEGADTLPGREWAVWLTQLSVPLVVGPSLTYLLLIFPNGQLPSARWRPVAWYTAGAIVALTAAWTLLFTPIGYADLVLPNPVSLGLDINLDQRGQSIITQILLGPAAILCAAAFVHRFRRSQGVERQQLKWVAYAAVITLAVFLLPASSPPFSCWCSPTGGSSRGDGDPPSGTGPSRSVSLRPRWRWLQVPCTERRLLPIPCLRCLWK